MSTEERWLAKPLQCPVCGKEEVAVIPVFPKAPDKVECPHCGHMYDWRDR